jgi:hypothetical protein
MRSDFHVSAVNQRWVRARSKCGAAPLALLPTTGIGDLAVATGET